MVGQNIGKYKVLDRVGRGGMGTVYRAIDETLHREVAIKVLNAELNDPAVARRFRAEAVTVARLNHPGIATVYELFQHEGQWLMVMEFVRGETLEGLVTRKGRLSIEESAELMMQALGALAHAHSMGVVHRDLKPANVMVTESGTVKVMDFGIARVAGTEHLTSAGFMMGTPAYMAPEQVLGKEIDARTDLYALGVVFYHLVTGKLPFKGDTPMEMAQSHIQDEPTPVRMMRQDLPDWCGRVLEIALARQPERRFQTAPVFRDALRRGLANLPLDTSEATAIHPELVATAAPRSLPIQTSPDGSPRRVQPPPDSLPTVAASIPVVAVDLKQKAPSKLPIYVGVAAGVVAIAGLVLWLMRTPAPSPVVANAVARPSASPPPTPIDVAPETAVAAPVTPPPSAGSPVSTAPVSTPPAGTPPPSTVSLSSPASTAPTTSGGVASGATAGAPSAGARSGRATTAGRAGVRGRGAQDPILTFPNIRALAVAGKEARDQPASLQFGNGQIATIADRGTAELATISYRDLTYAAYVRAKDPKWSPILAAPPADVDLPGGLFRQARHWLSLQSRASYIIVRLNDGDWRKILDAVTARTGVKVEQPAAGSK